MSFLTLFGVGINYESLFSWIYDTSFLESSSILYAEFTPNYDTLDMSLLLSFEGSISVRGGYYLCEDISIISLLLSIISSSVSAIGYFKF